MRFNSLKLFTDIIIHYLNEESVYDSAGTKPTSKIINDIITKKLLPNTESILSDQEPVPLYGLKLFSIVFGKNTQFIAKIKQDRTLNIFLEYFNSKPFLINSNSSLPFRQASKTDFKHLENHSEDRRMQANIARRAQLSQLC